MKRRGQPQGDPGSGPPLAQSLTAFSSGSFLRESNEKKEKKEKRKKKKGKKTQPLNLILNIYYMPNHVLGNYKRNARH